MATHWHHGGYGHFDLIVDGLGTLWSSASLAINHTVVALAMSECVASAKTALVSDVGLPTSAAYLSQAAEAVGLPMVFAPFLVFFLACLELGRLFLSCWSSWKGCPQVVVPRFRRGKPKLRRVRCVSPRRWVLPCRFVGRKRVGRARMRARNKALGLRLRRLAYC